MNKGCLKLGLTALLGGMTLMAWAADPVAVLQQPQGKVFVSQGKVMAPVQQSLPLYPGNRVIVASGGRAEIVYTDGCMVALPENSLLAIQGADQCRLSQAQVRATGGFQKARIGQAGPIASNEATAEIRQVEGSGVVGQSRAAPGMRLFKGNKVTAGSDSQVVIRYSNGCEVTVEANQSLVIDVPPVDCAVGGTGALIVGGAFVASVGAAILADEDDDDASPAN
jgi:hypothetical protein